MIHPHSIIREIMGGWVDWRTPRRGTSAAFRGWWKEEGRTRGLRAKRLA